MTDDPFAGLPPELAEQLAGLSVPDDVSSLLDGDVGTTLLPSQTNSVQVIATIDPPDRSPYVTTVQPSDDVAIVLPYERAVAYGMAVLAAAHRAHYAAAVLAQARAILTGRNVGGPRNTDRAAVDGNARFLLLELLQDLPELDDAATAPLRFRPAIRTGGEPVVRVSLPPHDTPFTGWSFAEACEHGRAVLDQAVVSQLDTAYRNTIAVGFEAGENRGRAAVSDLANYWPHSPFGDAAAPVAPRRPPDPRRARPTGKGKGKKRR